MSLSPSPALARLLACLALTAIGASARAEASAAPSTQSDYRCLGGLAVRVLYDNSGPGPALAWVYDGTQTHRLSAVRSASGARYSDGRWTWWSKGSEALFERQGRPHLRSCKWQASRGVLIDRRTRTQWLLPQGWSRQRVEMHLSLGAEAEQRQAGAQLVASFGEKRAPTSGAAPAPLLQLMVFPTEQWEAMARHAGAALPGEAVFKTPTWSYVVSSPPPANPYPAGTPKAEAYDALQATPAQLREGLSLWGHGPQLPGRPAIAMAATPATAATPTATAAASSSASAAETAGPNSACQISGSVSYRERMALLPGDELLVQLLDASQPDAPPRVLSEQRLSNPGQVPLHFLLSCDAKSPGQRANFLITARILRDGRPLFSGSMPLPPGDQTKDLELMLSQMRGLPAKPNAENSR